MVNVFSGPKKKDENNEERSQIEKQEIAQTKFQEPPAATLQKLKVEEAELFEERQSLLQMKEQLQRKIKDQIENSKSNLQKLRAEVDQLKAECTELNFTLQEEILAE